MRKSLHTLFIFVLGVFIVSGASYIYTKSAQGAPSNPPANNTFVPINESSKTQGRCTQTNTGQALDPTKMYTNCSSGANLITNGVFVKTPKTWFTIYGDPASSDTKQRKGGLFVGCTTDSDLVSDPAMRSLCKNKDSSPEAYFNGDIILDEFAGGPSTDRKLCIENRPSVLKDYPERKGKIVLCP